jgi:hypothetical protein
MRRRLNEYQGAEFAPAGGRHWDKYTMRLRHYRIAHLPLSLKLGAKVNFKHNDKLFILGMLVHMFLGVSIGFFLITVVFDEVSGGKFIFFLAFFITFTFAILFKTTLKLKRFNVSINNKVLAGPNSLSGEITENFINLDKFFVIKRLWIQLPFAAFIVSQGRSNIVFSTYSIGRKNTAQLRDVLKNHLTK